MDELDKTVANAFWLGTNKFQWDATGNYIEASSIVKGLNDIAAAIRERWPWIDWPCVSKMHDDLESVHIWKKHLYEEGSKDCVTCGYPTKPGPAPGDYIVGVDPAVPGGDFSVELTMKREGDSLKVVEVKTAARADERKFEDNWDDERGVDQEAIRMWRDKP